MWEYTPKNKERNKDLGSFKIGLALTRSSLINPRLLLGTAKRLFGRMTDPDFNLCRQAALSRFRCDSGLCLFLSQRGRAASRPETTSPTCARQLQRGRLSPLRKKRKKNVQRKAREERRTTGIRKAVEPRRWRGRRMAIQVDAASRSFS